MLKTILVKSLVKDMIFVNKGNIINEIYDDANRIDGVKFKNMIMLNFLAKSQLSVKPIFKSDFLIFEVMLVFTK